MSETFDLHQQITDQIVRALETTTGDFVMPWHRAAATGHPVNATSRRRYNGINAISLWVAAMNVGYATPQWATFKQWRDAGAQVRKGEMASLIVFYKTFTPSAARSEPAPAPDAGDQARRFLAKPSWVFNAAQVDGYKVPKLDERPQTLFERISTAEQAIRAAGADIRYGGSRAYYDRLTDHIQIPAAGDFIGSPTSTPRESFYSTVFHELAHWVGSESRLNREKGARFGDKPYALEELIAELSAAMCCAEFGIACVPRLDHAHYLASWLKILKDEKRAIFTAAAAASAATTFIKAFSQSRGDDLAA
jgi:antirestriction protein ArdC